MPSVEETMIPRLDAKEVAAVFTAPFTTSCVVRMRTRTRSGIPAPQPPSSQALKPRAFRRNEPVAHAQFLRAGGGQSVARPRSKKGKGGEAASPEEKEQVETADALAHLNRFRVFGMTARILVDAARVAYAEEPDFEHNSHFGDEEMIARLLRAGRLSAERKRGQELTREDLRAAAKL
ncbi:8-oxo-dGTP diphosphatase [Coniosporium tulheliwenetii]|uniref:8-oxo-dGTP diphosphatase n=1 Tax=Coniosporium tulheliwenetii TaxID=3383036 RepID=A0ACC2ZL14_9PEZI|nr:8-oxo-dGTP diphosphatase [Cladosporium sp. JES 115]